jgi:hypothetical protein
MSRSLFVTLLAAAFLVAPAALPSAFVPAIAPNLSGSAKAVTNLNSSRSNIYRTQKADTTKQPTTGGKAVPPKRGDGAQR